MDHSYSTERLRLQRSDHSYFTVGKKTPQVVLRKAQHLRELSLETAKSSIGQDHSYVRSDHPAQQITTSFDGLDALIKAISYRESEADNEYTQHSAEMEIPDCELQVSLQHHVQMCLSPPCVTDVHCADSGQTVFATNNAAESMTYHRTDLDNLPCWIGCIQLDHPYDSHRVSSDISDLQPALDCYHNVSEPTNASDIATCNRNAGTQCGQSQVALQNCWIGFSDHAYESSSWDSVSTGDQGRWDHAYNIQCTADELSSAMGRSVSVQHLDHSYDTRMSSELSHSETVLSSFLDHAYVASDWTVTSARRHTSGQRWCSSDDLRTVGKALPAFLC